MEESLALLLLEPSGQLLGEELLIDVVRINELLKVRDVEETGVAEVFRDPFQEREGLAADTDKQEVDVRLRLFALLQESVGGIFILVLTVSDEVVDDCFTRP